MKNFRLLLKNSIKSLWNSRGLVTQFTILTTIATIVVSSVSLANFSLRNSMSNIEKESNLSGFSIQSRNVRDFASYNLVKSSNQLVKTLDNDSSKELFDLKDLTMENARGKTKIYNPFANKETVSMNVNGKTYTTYGFFEKYKNNGYTTIPDSEKWNGIAFSNKNESLPIITQMTDVKYAELQSDGISRISDVYSFYNNVLPPAPTDAEGTNYQVFFDPNIYSFNPWTITFKNNNTEMATNPAGIGRIENFENDYKEDLFFNHGIFDNKFSFLVGTDNSFLDKYEMSQYSTEMDIVNEQIKIASQDRNCFSNYWKQPGRTRLFANRDDLISYTNWWFTEYSDRYHEFLNTLSDKIKNNFMMETKYFQLNYSINPETSEGLSKYFTNLYTDKDGEFYTEIKEAFKEDQKYFSGSIDIPLIPFITVSPKISDGEKWVPNQYKDWATSQFTDPTKTIPNVSGIRSVVNDAFNFLSSKINSVFREKLNKVSTKIRDKYNEDYNLDYYLKNVLNVNFSKSSNFTINDTNNNSYIMSKTKNFTKEKVNDIVINNGRGIIENKINSNYLKTSQPIFDYFERTWPDVLNWNKDDAINYFLNDDVFFPFMSLLSQARLDTNEATKQEFHDALKITLDLDLMRNDFEKWKATVKEFIWKNRCTLFSWNGAGYKFEFIRKIGVTIDFGGLYYEPSSYTAVLSMNYSQLKNKNKEIINSKFVEDAMKLPYKKKMATEEDILSNFQNYQNNFIYNPYTKKTEFYNDFLDWLARLDSKYKINVNGDEMVIIGTGINREFVYPITSSNQLLINNNAPVVFANELGYDKIAYNNLVGDRTNYFANFNSGQYFTNNWTLNKINEWTRRVHGNDLAFRITDSKQPSKLLYQRMNFPNTILSVVLAITLIIASIVVGLSLVFIFVLTKSIVNQNMNTFAIGMANGISKRKLLFSFMPFVLIPSSISAILGYSFSFLLYPVISNSIQNYWILDYIHFPFNFGYLILAFIFITILIFIIQAIVIFVLLNKNVSILLNKKIEFKYNKLVEISHKSLSKFKPLTSFRISYMLGNIGRLLLLLLMMTSFVTLSTVSASTLNTFDTAMTKTMNNKEYNYAIDLMSPTVQGGYYYDVPYSLLGSRQKGLMPLYDLNQEVAFYGKEYKDSLTYNIPNTTQDIVYENLFLPSASLVGDVQANILFFRNKISYLPTMDFGINFLGNYINPWEWAKKVFPNSIINVVEEKLQQQLKYAFLYVCSIMDDYTNPDRDIWVYDKTNPNAFKESFNGTTNIEEWDQTNWLINLVKKNNKYIWKTNEVLLSTQLPNFTMTKPIVKLVTRLISFQNNPSYQKFISKLEVKENKKIDDFNFMVGLNVVPIVPELDETYTYISSISKLKRDSDYKKLKIYGIKPDSKQVILWDEYKKVDLKEILANYEVQNDIYPLIINEVVKKKYGYRVGDEIKIIANNKYNRIIDEVEGKENSQTYTFKVLGVTTSKSEEQFYTTQEIANTILGYEKPKLASKNDIDGKNYDYKWVNQEEIDNFVPFNGVFSKQELPKMLSNFATLYSPSGLSPISGSLPTSSLGDTYRQIQKNYTELNKVLKCNFVDETKPRDFNGGVKDFCDRFREVFGTDKYYNLALSGIDVTLAAGLLGKVMDSTIENVNLISVISLVPAILIIIILMSYMIVVESRRLVALLKVLGFSNWSNTITLSTVQFVVTGLSLLIGYGIAAIILFALKSFTFNFLNVIISPTIPLWTLAITLGTLLLITSLITLTIFFNLRNANPAQEIAMR